MLAIHSMSCHPCTAVTCLTAQNSQTVTAVHAAPPSFLREQLDVLWGDMRSDGVKIGMLGDVEICEVVGTWLSDLQQDRPAVVLDPVMISTSGHKLIQDDAKFAMVNKVFPHADVVTPNLHEAEELVGRKLKSIEDVELAAEEILKMGAKSVLIKGGHTPETEATSPPDPPATNATRGYAQDYFLSRSPPTGRLCDGSRGVWIRGPRYNSVHTHGTGCTLSSSLASALATGSVARDLGGSGAARAIADVDACVLAKGYVNRGISIGVGVGKGPGPVRHTWWPDDSRYFPSIVPRDVARSGDPPLGFKKVKRSDMPVLLPIVGTVEEVRGLAEASEGCNIQDIQVRIKGDVTKDQIDDIVGECQRICDGASIRLWVNDHWEAAVRHKCYGVHLGQEDLATCSDEGGLDKIRDAGLAMGISTHSYAELAVALGLGPSYVSLGPIFATKSKDVAFEAQGIDQCKNIRNLVGPEIPFVGIGGISDVETARTLMKDCGVDCIAAIGVIRDAPDVKAVVNKWEGELSKYQQK